MNTNTITNTFALAAAVAFFGLFSLAAQSASAQQYYPETQSQYHQPTAPQQNTTQSTPVQPQPVQQAQRPNIVLGIELGAAGGLDASGSVYDLLGADPEDTSGMSFKIRGGMNILNGPGLQFIPEIQIQHASMEGELKNISSSSYDLSTTSVSGGFRVGSTFGQSPFSGFAYVHAGYGSITQEFADSITKLDVEGNIRHIDLGGTINYAVTSTVDLGLNVGTNLLYDDEDNEIRWNTIGLHTEFRF